MSNFRGVATDAALRKRITAFTQRVYELVELTVYDTTTSADYTARVTNAPFDLTIGGLTYRAVGNILGFSDIEEATDFTISSVTVTLNGINSADVKLFLTARYVDKPIKIYRVWLDERNIVVSSPLLIFDGLINNPVISDDGARVTIGVEASSHWAAYDRRNGRHTNFDEQQFWFAGDLGFEFVASESRDLKWGSK
jgi:hypothetical protein